MDKQSTPRRRWVTFKGEPQLQKFLLKGRIDQLANMLFSVAGATAGEYMLSAVYELVLVGEIDRAEQLFITTKQYFSVGDLAEKAAYIIPMYQNGRLATHSDEKIAPFKALLAKNGCDLDNPPQKTGIWTFYPQPEQHTLLMEGDLPQVAVMLASAGGSQDAFLFGGAVYDLLQNELRDRAKALIEEGRKHYSDRLLALGASVAISRADAEFAAAPDTLANMIAFMRECGFTPPSREDGISNILIYLIS